MINKKIECKTCEGKKYLIVDFDCSGIFAVQRCDNCQTDIMTDKDAHELAKLDGIESLPACPRFLLGNVAKYRISNNGFQEQNEMIKLQKEYLK